MTQSIPTIDNVPSDVQEALKSLNDTQAKMFWSMFNAAKAYNAYEWWKETFDDPSILSGEVLSSMFLKRSANQLELTANKFDNLLRAARYYEAKSRSTLQSAPQINHETHVVVPREPTKEMVDRGERMMDNSTSSIDVFKSMIAAAPKYEGKDQSSPIPQDVQEHDWVYNQAVPDGWCRRCGFLKRADGKNNPCKGVVKVSLRGHVSIPNSVIQQVAAALKLAPDPAYCKPEELNDWFEKWRVNVQIPALAALTPFLKNEGEEQRDGKPYLKGE